MPGSTASTKKSHEKKVQLLQWPRHLPRLISNVPQPPIFFPEASTSEVRLIILTDSEQNKGEDSEKGDKEEVNSNNESNRDRENEVDKDRPEIFICLDVEMLNNIPLWPTTLADLMIDSIIRKTLNDMGNIETLKSVYKDRDQVYYRRLL
ncbi:hypothetical protein TNIN_143891 [Trichonephila inaurata madagascariensis]|uniref:Uncharacterized protein n=1 Tax=Trichonephila inaurata madagascariensis TaxID=2747483 RepID=A0A8X6XIP2_9ARAC|nr:hypothetical protein TNIN_143891 [Trichonephila inaurata madagascariensis]